MIVSAVFASFPYFSTANRARNIFDCIQSRVKQIPLGSSLVFNVTVQNSLSSVTYLNITRITVTVENETFPSIQVLPPLELGLYREKHHILQGYTVYYTKATPDPLTLIILSVHFPLTQLTSMSQLEIWNTTLRQLMHACTLIEGNRRNQCLKLWKGYEVSGPYEVPIS